MKDLILSSLASLFSLCAIAQCNTTLNQLLPDRAVNNDDGFGYRVAASGQYLVVTAETSDTLGVRRAGAAFVYEKTVGGWAYRAMLTPSEPEEHAFFGTAVAIDPAGTTITVLDQSDPQNRIYIFEKPASGWVTMKESHTLYLPDFVDIHAALDISEDASRIVINHPWSRMPNFAVFTKPAAGWGAAGEPQIVIGPQREFSSTLFATDVLMKGDYLYASATNDPIDIGIWVYKWNGSSYEYVATLSLSTPHNSTHYFGYHLTATDDMVAAAGAVVMEGGGRKLTIFVFRKDGEWEDAVESEQIQIDDFARHQGTYFPIEFLSSTELAATMLVPDGDWYTGKVFVMKASDETWQDVGAEVIFESGRLSSRSAFTLDLTWNGSDLVLSRESKPIGLATRNAVVSLTRNAGVWESVETITVSRTNSANFWFGSSVHKTENTLFAGAPYDGAAGAGAGAVYVYETAGDTFEKIHTILPPGRRLYPNGTRDSGFGYSIASFGDELAISAPSYRYADGLLGKIFLYRRTDPSWSSPVLYDSISPPEGLRIDHFGAAITMNDHLLFASGYDLTAQSNAVAIFERVDGKWIYRDRVAAGTPLDKSWPSVRMSLHGNKLLVGGYRSLNGGSFIFEEDAQHPDQWVATSTISSDALSSFGIDVKLLENHFFVGVPMFPYQGIKNAGAVFVYAKLPGENWTSQREPVAIIGAQTPIEGGYFGNAIDVIGNTLVVGAPGSAINEGGVVRNISGSTYVIQTEDFFWTKTTEFLKLQGNRYASGEVDFFGFDVGVDEGNFYIGARNENTAAGAFSGAVYYIPTPPLIYLIPPICRDEDYVQLKGYPFDGTWSGPGIEDPSGRFNPDLSGNGVFVLTYETVNCAYKGTVEVEVGSGPTVNRVSPAEVLICSEGKAQLELSEIADGAYGWYIKATESNDFLPIAGAGPMAEVSNPGEYFAVVSNGFCAINSPSFKVGIESVDIVIGPQPIVCNHDEVVPLDVSVDNGTWEGPGVSDNSFHSGTLANGKYGLVYRFFTPMGCSAAVRDSIEKKGVKPITLERIPGDFCATGSVAIHAVTADPTLNFTWFHKANAMEHARPIDQHLADQAMFFQPGYYHVSATNGDCTGWSEPLEVGFDYGLEFEMLPKEPPSELCAGDEYHLEVHTRPQTILTWHYRPNDEEQLQLISEGVATSFPAEETGYYKVKGTYGFCSFESSERYVSFRTDSLWAPNVFTPNGDEANEVFRIHADTDHLQLRIFNRYGKQIYITDTGIWDGGNAPAGVYFWQVNYIGCRDTSNKSRGWIQLMR